MKRLALAATALVALAASASAQVIPPGTNPVPSGGAYNSSVPTCVSGQACWLQVDVNGNLKVTGSSGGGAATIANGADVAEGSTTDAPATTPTTVAPATTIALLKALNNGVSITNFPATQPVSGTVTVVGPTADGSAASTNPVLISGTTDGTATGLVAVPKITAGGVLSVDGSASTQPVSGSVAVTSVVPGTAATNLGKAEDSVHASGDVGVFGLALANEAQTVLAQDGDYIGHGADTKGNTFVTGPVASAATDSGNPIKIGGRYNSAVQAFTNGQRADLQVDQRGGLLIQDGQAIPSVSVTSAATLFTIADTSGYSSVSLQVTSAGVATITYENCEDGVTWTSVGGYISTATTGGSGITTSNFVFTGSFPLLAKQFRARVSSYTSGTVTIQGTLKKDALPRAFVGTLGSVGDGTGITSVSIPTAVEARTTNKGAVTNGTFVRPIATSIGVSVNKPFQVPELDWSYPAAAGGISNTTTAVTMVGAAGAGIRNYLTAIQVSAGALGAASEIAVRDGAGGTVIWRGFISTAGGNQSVNLSSPIKSTANTLLEVVTLTATITGAVYINAQGYQAP